MSGSRRLMDVNMAVVGGKHWTKQEIEDRTNSEVKLPKPKKLTPPKWLSDDAKKLFRQYAKQLLEFPAAIVSALDVGTLARYCDNELSYADASKHKNVWMEVSNRRLQALCQADALAVSKDEIERYADAYEESKAQLGYWTKQTEKFERMARGCAVDMGLTVSSRCRLVVPKSEDTDEEDPLAVLQKKLLGG